MGSSGLLPKCPDKTHLGLTHSSAGAGVRRDLPRSEDVQEAWQPRGAITPRLSIEIENLSSA